MYNNKCTSHLWRMLTPCLDSQVINVVSTLRGVGVDLGRVSLVYALLGSPVSPSLGLILKVKLFHIYSDCRFSILTYSKVLMQHAML
ncbi:hypothetical protein Patl1_28507 [Pistacia atlantica]|uniref:Uncharacterized protein n=1 Tax=Pistacia atlantica TaxID=434234 RepID=A0ACC1BGU6_9ROSI|nr:hypothetical protein Patl1_28507 [Pistacia atlantica]